MRNQPSSDQHSTKFSSSAPNSISGRTRNIVDMKIGPYQIKEQLGQGGMGSVYLAEQNTPVKRTVAIKIINEGIRTKALVDRFKFERQTLANLNHPNISKLLDVGTTPEGLPFFAMELVTGSPITQFCDENAFSLHQRLKVFRTVCAAISYAHQNGVIHRDLKPSNILVEQSNDGFHLKVIDFGLAKIIELEEGDSFQNQIMGTLAYMSPEQAGGDSQITDTRSDIYSLGIVLFELLVGELPKEKSISPNDENTQTVVGSPYRVPSKPSKQIESFHDRETEFFKRRKISRSAYLKVLKYDLDWILTKATAEEKQDRYQSCRELIQDIDNFLNGDPIASHPNSLRYRAGKWISKYRVLFAISLLFSFFLLGSLATAIYMAWWARTEMFAHKNSAEEASHAQKQAEISEGRAKATLKLITDSFKNMNPNEAGEDMMAGDALFAAYHQSKGLLQDDPIGRAELLYTLGNSFLGLGEFDAGTKASEEALKIFEEQYGQNHPDSLKARLNLMSSVFGYQNSPKYLQFVKDSRRVSLESFDPNSIVHQNIQLKYARVLIDTEGKIDEGYQIFKKSVDEIRAHCGQNDLNTLVAESEFSLVQFKKGYTDSAVKSCYEAMEKIQNQLGITHPITISARSRTAKLEQSRGRPWLAEKILRKSFDSLSKILNERHRDVLRTKLLLARTLTECGKLKESRIIAEEVLEAYQGLFGKDNLQTILALEEVVASASSESEAKAAIEKQKSAVRFKKKYFGESHLETLSSMCMVGELYFRSGDFNEAIVWFRQVEEKLDFEQSQVMFPHRESLIGLAKCYGKLGQLDDAMKFSTRRLNLEKSPSLSQKGRLLKFHGELQFLSKDFQNAAQTLKTAADLLYRAGEKQMRPELIRLGIQSSRFCAECQYSLQQYNEFVSETEKAIQQQWKLIGSNNRTNNQDMNNQSRMVFNLARFRIRTPKNNITLDLHKEFDKLVEARTRIHGPNHFETVYTISQFLLILEQEKDLKLPFDLIEDGLMRCQRALKTNPQSSKVRMVHSVILQQKVNLLLATHQPKKASQTVDEVLDSYQKSIDSVDASDPSFLWLGNLLQLATQRPNWSKSQQNRLKALIKKARNKKRNSA